MILQSGFSTGADQGIGPLVFIIDAIRMANPVWHLSKYVCPCYQARQDWSIPPQSSIHSARVDTKDRFTYCGFHMNCYRSNSASSRYVTPEDTLSHYWFILTTRSPPSAFADIIYKKTHLVMLVVCLSNN